VDFVTVTGFRGFREFRFLGRPVANHTAILCQPAMAQQCEHNLASSSWTEKWRYYLVVQQLDQYLTEVQHMPDCWCGSDKCHLILETELRWQDGGRFQN